MPFNPKSLQNLVPFQKGHKNWNKGLSKKELLRHYSDGFIGKPYEKGWVIPDKIKAKRIHSQKQFYKINPKSHYKPEGLNFKGKHHTKSSKQKISNTRKELYKNPQFKERQVHAMIQGLIKRPTSLEFDFIKLFSSQKINAVYIGDGSKIIEGKNPDFIIPNNKIVIDVRHTTVCKFKNKISFREYKNRRITFFKSKGWTCLVYSEKNLTDKNKVIKEVKDAMQLDNFNLPSHPSLNGCNKFYNSCSLED